MACGFSMAIENVPPVPPASPPPSSPPELHADRAMAPLMSTAPIASPLLLRFMDVPSLRVAAPVISGLPVVHGCGYATFPNSREPSAGPGLPPRCERPDSESLLDGCGAPGPKAPKKQRKAAAEKMPADNKVELAEAQQPL